MNSEDHKIKSEPVNNDRIRELQEQILELKKRWPAHSVSPAMLLRLDELEEELENEQRKIKDE
ncbi:MAG: histidine kinase [Omnitrophica WOR_2 bacterium]